MLYFNQCSLSPDNLVQQDVGIPTPNCYSIGRRDSVNVMPYVYILQNNKGKYYIGSTTNIDKRINHHKKGYSISTKKWAMWN